MGLEPLGKFVLLEPGEAPEVFEDSSIVIPENQRARHRLVSRVIAVGPEAEKVRAGEVVIYQGFAGTEFTWQRKQYRVIHEDDILVRIQS